MVHRKWWKNLIEETWLEKNVVWLSGIRRVGKTFLCRSLPDIEYFDCELPKTRRPMDDPEGFLEGLSNRRIVLDEVHRLQNPAQLLKIAADHFPACRILATGSSTLGASAKFKDTLSGRKRDLWLTPMTTLDLTDFNNKDLHHRLLRGGLPPFFLSKRLPDRNFQEWVDAYWAKDIQELFRLQNRSSFQKFVELLLAQSGGIFEATRFARPCEVSRTTISNYLAVLEATFIAHVIKPFSSHRPTEIVSAPKVFGFDTGFVCYHKGWNELHADEYGILWEHFVLNEMQASLQTRKINYWRDKRSHDVDFVLVRPGNKPIAIESKWSADGFDPGNIHAFRKQYPSGENYVVARDVKRKYSQKYRNVSVEFVSLPDLIAEVSR